MFMGCIASVSFVLLVLLQLDFLPQLLKCVHQAKFICFMGVLCQLSGLLNVPYLDGFVNVGFVFYFHRADDGYLKLECSHCCSG